MKDSTKPLSPMPAGLIAAAHAPPVPVIIAGAFARLNLRQRTRMLRRLLASVGPLGLKVMGGGAFAKYVVHARSAEVPISLEDAGRVTGEQVHEIASYVQQSDPQVVHQLLDLLARDMATMTALGAAAAALTVGYLAKRRV